MVSGTGYVCIPKDMPFDELDSEVEHSDETVEAVVKEAVENGGSEKAAEKEEAAGDGSEEKDAAAQADTKKVIGKLKYKVGDWEVGSTDILFTGEISGMKTNASEGATAGMTGPAPEEEPDSYGTAHYSDNKSFVDGIRYFFRGIFHSGANGTMYLNVPALLFLIIIVSAILIVVILIFSYMGYIRRRRLARRRRRKKK